MESPDHGRRDVLRTLGAAATLPALANVAGAQSTDQDGYGPLGRVEVPGTTEAVVSGDVAYLATTTGFATVDVSDPADPTVLADRRDLLADREDGPLPQIYDVKVEDDRLLVAGPANQGRPTALVLYDVADPADPTRVSVYETGTANHNVYLEDGVAYRGNNYDAAGRNALVMVDVEAGEELGRWSPLDEDETWGEVAPGLRTLHDLYVHEGVAYLAYWDAGTWLLDVSEPASPSVLGHVRGRPPEELAALSPTQARNENFRPPGNDHYVAVNDDASLMGVGMESWAVGGEGGPSGVELFDVSDPTAPESLTTLAPPPTDRPSYGGVWTTSHNFDFADDRLYTSWYRGGVKVFDLSDPARPGVLREWADRESASVWTAQALTPGETFVASTENHRDTAGLFNGLLVFPDAPADERATPGPTPTDAGTAAPAPSGTGTETEGQSTGAGEPPTTGSEATADGSSGAGPGFGILAGVAGGGLAAWRLLAGREAESE
jgi:hypothetical protein